MISDVLANAYAEIERYQKEFPDMYGDFEMRVKIEAVKMIMESLRIDLDTPPESRPKKLFISGEIS